MELVLLAVKWWALVTVSVIPLFWKGGRCKSGHQCSQSWCSLLRLCYDVYSWGSNKVYYSPPQNRVTWENNFCRKSEYWSSKISHYHQIVQVIKTTFSADDVQNKFQAKNEPAGKKPSEKKENEAKKETVSERYCCKNSLCKGVLLFFSLCWFVRKNKVTVRISVTNIQKEW